MASRIAMTEAQIDRRIRFLIDESQHRDGKKDQVVGIAFRVITNWIAVGDDVSSADLKRRCLYRSKAAHEAFGQMSFRDWCADTINEHQHPLRRSWEWMKQGERSVEEVKAHLRMWPVVVVTRKDNGFLKDIKGIEPDERYRRAGIEILRRGDDGAWLAHSAPSLEAV